MATRRVKGKRVIDRATGRTVHKAPTKVAASAVARRMDGVAVLHRFGGRAM